MEYPGGWKIGPACAPDRITRTQADRLSCGKASIKRTLFILDEGFPVQDEAKPIMSVQTNGPGNDRSPASARACEHARRSRRRQAVRGEDEPGGPHATPEFPLFHVAEDHEALTRAAEPAASLFGQGERLLRVPQWPMFNTGSAFPRCPPIQQTGRSAPDFWQGSGRLVE